MARATSKNIEQVTENIYILRHGATADLVQFSRGDDASFLPAATLLGESATLGTGKSVLFQPHGARNDMPQARERLVADNNVIGALMETKRDIWIGLGLMPIREVFENGTRRLVEVAMPTAADEFFDKVNIDGFLRDAFGEMAIHGGFLPEAARLKGGEISDIGVKKSRHMRSGRKDVTGNVSSWYWCGDWQRKLAQQFPIQEIPLYNKALEVLPSYRRQLKFLYPLSCSLLTDDYYPIPVWQGSRDWAELSNMIPQFHLFNLDNGFTPRWHVTIPDGYFKDTTMRNLTEADMKNSKNKEEAARKNFLGKLNKYLAGLRGTGRALVTDEFYNPLAKEFSGIKIKPLEVDLKDEAMLKLYEKSNQAVIAAQSLHPTLAAIETGQTRAGGSEILRALQLYLITKTKQPRSTVLQFINLIHRINGWEKGIKWTFRDETLTTLADNTNGVMKKEPN
jgi:hypothetical protein